VLWPIGLLSNALGGNDPAGLATGLIKLPPMLMDLAVGWLLTAWYWAGRGRAAGRRRSPWGRGAVRVQPRHALRLGAVGQTDAAGALVLLLCVAALVRAATRRAAALAVLAAMVKPQFGFVAVPLVAVVLLRRHGFLRAPGRASVGARVPARLAGAEQGSCAG
jgi:hypothetical protein